MGHVFLFLVIQISQVVQVLFREQHLTYLVSCMLYIARHVVKKTANFTEQKYCLSMANVANCVDLTGDLHGLFLCRDAPKNQSAELGVLAKGIMPEGIAVQIPSKAFHNSNQCKKGDLQACNRICNHIG